MNFLYFFFQLGVGVLFIMTFLFGLFISVTVVTQIRCKLNKHEWEERSMKQVGDMTIVGNFKKCKRCEKEVWHK